MTVTYHCRKKELFILYDLYIWLVRRILFVLYYNISIQRNRFDVDCVIKLALSYFTCR